MRAPRAVLPTTTPVRTGSPGSGEAARPVWLWRGSGPALTPRGLVPLQIEGAAPAVVTAHGPGLRIERGTTNFVTNPSFEVDLSGWSAVAGATISQQVSGGGAFGAAYARIDVTSTGHGMRVTGSGNAAQGDPYTASVHLRAASPTDVGKTVQVYLDASGGTYEIFATDHVLTEGWSRVVIATTWAQSGHTGWGLAVRNAIPQGEFSVCVDAVQYEATSVTSYADGGGGTGYAWTGTEHASASTRTGAAVGAAVLLPPACGTLVVGVSPFWTIPSDSDHVLIEVVVGGQHLTLRATGTGNWLWGSPESTVVLPQSPTESGDVLLCASWTSDSLLLRAQSVETRGAWVPATPAAVRHIGIGRSEVGDDEHLAGVILGAACFGHVLEQPDVDRLAAAISHSGWSHIR
ncbi:MAG: hypothetical protein WC211_12125 [Dehalococcoidia bacterium]